MLEANIDPFNWLRQGQILSPVNVLAKPKRTASQVVTAQIAQPDSEHLWGSIIAFQVINWVQWDVQVLLTLRVPAWLNRVRIKCYAEVIRKTSKLPAAVAAATWYNFGWQRSVLVRNYSDLRHFIFNFRALYVHLLTQRIIILFGDLTSSALSTASSAFFATRE